MVIRVEVCNNQLKPSLTSAPNPLMRSHASWRNSLTPHLAFQVISLLATLMPHFSDLGSQVIPSLMELLAPPSSQPWPAHLQTCPTSSQQGLCLWCPLSLDLSSPSHPPCLVPLFRYFLFQRPILCPTHRIATTPTSDYQFILYI